MAPRIPFYKVPFIMLSTEGSLRSLTYTEFKEYTNRTKIFIIHSIFENNYIDYDLSKLSSVMNNFV